MLHEIISKVLDAMLNGTLDELLCENMHGVLNEIWTSSKGIVNGIHTVFRWC